MTQAGPLLLSVGEDFRQAALDGGILLALGAAVLAGVVSFLSPCVLPLVPSYLSYVTGMSGADISAAGARGKGRLLLGTGLFVLGFAAVFVSFGSLFGAIGYQLLAYEVWVNRVLGLVVIALGLAFLGVLPGSDREWRLRRLPQVGLAGAPLLGVVFGVGWTPCIGPTLGVVLGLASSDDQASAARGALLAFVYALGLGLPFLLAAVGYRRALSTFSWVQAHSRLVTRIGGGMLVLLGILLVTGLWAEFSVQMRVWLSGFGTVI